MEEGDGINMAHNGRQKAKERIARSETFPRTCHPQRTSSGHPQTFSSILSFPTTSYSYDKEIHRSSVPSFNTQLDQGAALYQQPYVSNDASFAGDTSMMGNSDAVLASSSKICQAMGVSSPSATNGTFSVQVVVSSSEISQATRSLNSGTSQGEDPRPSPTNGSIRELTLDEYRARCGPLLQAAMKGDWPAAKAFHEKYPDYVRAPITKEKARALHIAVIAQRTTFIKEWLKLMTPDDLELKIDSGFTALHFAAQSGIVRIAEQLVNINNKPLMITNDRGDVPLNVAAYLGHANMVSYLLPQTDLEKLNEKNLIELLLYTIRKELYDTTLKILESVQNVATAETDCWWQALKILATKPIAIGSKSRLSFWKSLLNSWFKGIYNKALMMTLAHQLVESIWKIVQISETQSSSNLADSKMIEVIFEAAKIGNVEFLIILSRSYPDLLWQLNENNESIFHIAVEYRHEHVFNLRYEIGITKDSIASRHNSKTNENMLHLVGKLPSSDRLNIVSGAALQMQRELLWFKEIEKIVPASYVNKMNSNKQTPKQLFIKTHKKLQIEGEKWMKDTANYCMLVATLIATVIFSATFTLPGGNDQETGTPIFLRRTWFMVFFISNAIALGSSSTSIVIFLSILTSRYKEEDFLISLPSKLVFGLVTLFVSMAGMMVAFTANCFLVCSTKRVWVALAIVIFSAGFPVTMFIWLHYKLWLDTLLSTYKAKFFRPDKHRLFQQKMPIGE